LGGAKYDPSTGQLVSAEALRFYYYLKDETTNKPRPLTEAATSKAMAMVLAWETQFLCSIVNIEAACLETTSDAKTKSGSGGSSSSSSSDDDVGADSWPSLDISGYCKKSIDDEIARNVNGSTIFMVISINLILLLMAFTLGGMPCAQSRVLLAVGAVATIILSELCGFGLTALFGVPFTDITLMLVFIAVGIGVDDVVVLVDAFTRTGTSSSSGQVAKRLQQQQQQQRHEKLCSGQEKRDSGDEENNQGGSFFLGGGGGGGGDKEEEDEAAAALAAVPERLGVAMGTAGTAVSGVKSKSKNQLGAGLRQNWRIERGANVLSKETQSS
jgi:hypothetical protein